MNKLKTQIWTQEQQNHQRMFRDHAFKLEEMIPSRGVADQLLDLYLTTFETTYRIFHAPTLLRQYETFWAAGTTETVLLAKLLALMAVSSGFYSPVTKLDDGQPLHQAAARWLIGRAVLGDVGVRGFQHQHGLAAGAVSLDNCATV